MPTTSDFETASDAVLPPRPSGLARRVGQFVIAGGAIAVLSVFAREVRAPGPAAPVARAEAAPEPGFVSSTVLAARPVEPLALTAPRFRLDDPEALEPVRADPARRNPSTGRREDILVQGGFSTIEAPYLRLTLMETPRAEPTRSLFVTLARRAADGQALAVIRAGERGVVETKFGAVETLEITLGGEGRRTCMGFASLAPGPLRLDGWLCGPLSRAPEPSVLACTLDRVSLNGQAWPEGEDLFGALDARRDPACQPRPAIERAASSQTGSIANRPTRKNEAKLRPSRKAGR